MSYIINKTDGSVLTEIVDGSIDQVATDVTLIGKNASTYGEFLNENFLHLLENFANTSQPNRPITGQLWFDTSESRLKIYDGNGFASTSGTIVSTQVPSSIAQGDIWIDSQRQQLYFNDGVATLLAGPVYTQQQGFSGFEVEDILDSNQNSHTILSVYLAKTLLGVFSKDAFTPATAIAGISGDLGVGFNASTLSGYKFNASAATADALVDSFGNLKTVNDLVIANGDSHISGTLSLLNPRPAILGDSSQNEINVTNSSFVLSSNKSNQNIEISTKTASGVQHSFFINTLNQYTGINTNIPAASLHVGNPNVPNSGNVIIEGDLLVKGATTTINTSNLSIEDKLIDLATVDSPTDITADGGGINVKGATDKSLTYANSTSSWLSNQNFDIASGKTYKINGTIVLSSTALGASITSAPGLVSVGSLNSLQAGNINISTNNVISYVNSGVSDGDIVFLPKGAGNVNVSSRKITNLATPSDGGDAVNYTTLTATTRSIPLAISADTTGLSDAQIASNVLAVLYPTSEHENGTICRIWCQTSGSHAVKQYQIIVGSWTYQSTL